MPKIYVGNNNIAKKAKNIYIGNLSGRASRCKKVYVGDANGKARLAYMRIDTPIKVYGAKDSYYRFSYDGTDYSSQYQMQTPGEWNCYVPLKEPQPTIRLTDAYHFSECTDVNNTPRQITAGESNTIYLMPPGGIFFFGQNKNPFGTFSPNFTQDNDYNNGSYEMTSDHIELYTGTNDPDNPGPKSAIYFSKPSNSFNYVKVYYYSAWAGTLVVGNASGINSWISGRYASKELSNGASGSLIARVDSSYNIYIRMEGMSNANSRIYISRIELA